MQYLPFKRDHENQASPSNHIRHFIFLYDSKSYYRYRKLSKTNYVANDKNHCEPLSNDYDIGSC
jgi:hypothetical protein